MTGVRTDDKGQIGEPWHDRNQCRNLIKKPWAFIRVPAPYMYPTIWGL